MRTAIRLIAALCLAPELRDGFANAGLVPVNGSAEHVDGLILAEPERVISERGIKG